MAIQATSVADCNFNLGHLSCFFFNFSASWWTDGQTHTHTDRAKARSIKKEVKHI